MSMLVIENCRLLDPARGEAVERAHVLVEDDRLREIATRRIRAGRRSEEARVGKECRSRGSTYH